MSVLSHASADLAGLWGLLVAPPSSREARLAAESCERAAVEVVGLLSLSPPEAGRERLRPGSLLSSRDDFTRCRSGCSCLPLANLQDMDGVRTLHMCFQARMHDESQVASHLRL